MSASVVARIAAMDRGEAWFRIVSGFRKSAGRLRSAAARPAWNREDLLGGLAREFDGGADWQAALGALRRRDFGAAAQAMERTILARPLALPVGAAEVPAVAAHVLERVPAARHEAAAQADAILAGRYNLLGYRALHVPAPIDWHRDHAHGRRAPRKFWANVPYLDPAYGDHKVTWELNRHQHWLVLGRAYALTGDPRYAREFVAQLHSWLEANPPLVGTNWASMLELAFRCLSWLSALAFFAGRAIGRREWLLDLLLGLDRQLTHVEQNLSRYFSPNTHLTGEALALYVAGRALPFLAASARRASLGRDVLLEEATRQVKPDGGHAELSGHYHRYSTDFYLLALSVARRSGDPAASGFEEAAQRQARYLRAICDDAGRRPQFGDDDGGQLFPICGRDAADCRDTLASAAVLLGEPDLAVDTATPEETLWFCGSAAFGAGPRRSPARPASMAFPESGYYVSRGADGDHLVFDAGPHGYLNGGHAHADALSIVGTVGNLPLLIDPGTATYTMDRVERDLFRGTAMHNTITLDGEGQSMPRGPFHWSRTARATASIWRSAPGCDYAEGTHDGYLPRRHTRAILAVHGLGWFIVDHLVGAGTASAAIHWHLHPQWILDTTGPRGIVAAQGEHEIGLASSEPLRIVEPGSDPLARFSPAYGVTAPAPLVQVRADVSLPISFATFIATRTAPVRLERLEVTVAPPPGWLAAAFRAEWPTGTMTLLSAVELTGVATTASAAPDQLWGTSTVQTDGRVAALIEGSTGGPEVLLVNAHHAAGAISHHAPERVGLIRWPAGRVASSVHERSAPNP